MLGRYTIIDTRLGQETAALTPEQEAMFLKKKKQTLLLILFAVPFVAIMMEAAGKAVEKMILKKG